MTEPNGIYKDGWWLVLVLTVYVFIAGVGIGLFAR